MALKKTITTVNGIEVADAYHKVVNPYIIDKATLCFQLESFNISPESHPIPVAKQSFTTEFDMHSLLNIFQQAYSHVKSIPAWADAVDC